jgi:uncharacterized membrane protein YbaN (DUF454 family)
MIKKIFWYMIGMFCLGMAYIGLVTPGIPFSIFLVIAAYSFSKSSERMHKWIYNNKHFGPFLTNWTEKRIFPTKMKYVMIITMLSTLVFTWVVSGNINAVLWSGLFMFLVALWALRYPGSETEWARRKENNEKIAWIK